MSILMCIHCGKRPGVERDHAIPKQLFPKPYPLNMPTVPSCGECNRGTGDGGSRPMSEDEEYMRACFTVWDISEAHDAATNLFEGAVDRSMRRNASLVKQVFASVERDDYVAADGTRVSRFAFDMDLLRLRRVARKMIRGLHYHEFCQPIPSDFQIDVEFIPELDAMKAVNGMINTSHAKTGYKSLANDTVAYKGGRLFPGQPDAYWFITLFRSIPICASATRPGFFELTTDQVSVLANGSPTDAGQ